MSGPRFWKRQSRSSIEGPEALQSACIEYFDWAHDNPLTEAKAFAYQGDSWVESIDKSRAFTLKGLCVFLGINESKWAVWKSDPRLSDICGWAEDVIYTQKFEGAAAGLLNPSIIGRDLGLAEKSEVSSTQTIVNINGDEADL